MNLYPAEKIDGDWGPLSAAAITALALKRHEKVLPTWPIARRVVAGEQLIYEENGIEVGDIDGLVGTRTLYAREVWEGRKKTGGKVNAEVELWRDTKLTAPPPRVPQQMWPRQTQDELIKFFGPVGANQTSLVLPDGYPDLRLAWDTDNHLRKFQCHERVVLPMTRVLERVVDAYGPAKIVALGLDLFGGCLNVRRMRGGSSWSTHAWGIAVDFDPANNQLRWDRKRARFAKPEYVKWWELWEAEGAVSLGRVRDFDWMHVQFARL
jgi:hypothetical protein